MNPIAMKGLMEAGTKPTGDSVKEVATPAVKAGNENFKERVNDEYCKTEPLHDEFPKRPDLGDINKPILDVLVDILEERHDIPKASIFDELVEISEARNIKDVSVADKLAADIPNETRKVDDNGNVYREGNELKPNNTYEINGYKYETDERGRIISAEGTLQRKGHEGRRTIEDSMSDIGKGDQKPTDERGHLIGDQFNGDPGLENLVPQDAKTNNGEVKALECSLAKEVNNGKEVYLKVEPHYSGDSRRPDSFTYTYTIDGETSVKVFRNGGENG